MAGLPAALPPQTPPDSTSVLSPKALDALSAGTMVLTPVLALLPPRRLNLSTLALAATFSVAADYQLQRRTGQGALDWIARRQAPTTGLPYEEKPDAIADQRTASLAASSHHNSTISPLQQKISAAGNHNLALQTWGTRLVDPWARRGAVLGNDGRYIAFGANLDARSSRQDSTHTDWELDGSEQSLHTGRSNWKADRAAEERAAEARGEGISDLIVDQIWQVVNQEHREPPTHGSKTG